ncbi:MAG: ABC transporter permease [Deltaproteobacteria bacterium]|nr:ABC transporter permease [Deltaproteobacteria bacterium]MBI2179974.1 ABC transporter permease [Deltaproteobacteria bacterium]MBI2535228.1 ABC transporter permease [Deltaproteobacteria bacterium]MBI3064327.1 ABC transporter permease [Deltaproteobacteria bacterium]
MSAAGDKVEASAAPSGLWSGVRRQFRRNRIALAGFYVVVLLVLTGLGADFLANDRPLYLSYKGKSYFPILRGYLVDLGWTQWPSELVNADYKKLDAARAVFPPIPYRQTNIDLLAPLEPPSTKHWFGTDKLGRDVMAGMIHGSRISLSIGFVAVGIAVAIGVVLGALAGYFGSWVDIAISRLFEIMISIPTFFLLITVAAIFRPSIFMTMVIIGLTGWVGIGRFTRSEFLRIRNLDYVTAAISIGVSNRKVMFQHILPNALAPVIVSVVLGIAGAILVESSLSFLGIGVPAELVTWGSILNEASGATFAWWLAVFPGAAIFVTVLSYYLVGEGLREVLDPRLRGLR